MIAQACPPCYLCSERIEGPGRRCLVTVLWKGRLSELFLHQACYERFQRHTELTITSVMTYKLGAAPHVALWRADDAAEASA